MKTAIVTALFLISITGCQTPPQNIGTSGDLASPRSTEHNKSLGETKRQTGGVHLSMNTAQAVKNTAAGAYDMHLVAKVKGAWDELWSNGSPDRSGKVVVQFRLYPDGHIQNPVINQNEASDLMGNICVQAINKSAPYAEWPPEMRREIPDGYRDIQFAFYYSSQ
jgi:hypothetical protein